MSGITVSYPNASPERILRTFKNGCVVRCGRLLMVDALYVTEVDGCASVADGVAVPEAPYFDISYLTGSVEDGTSSLPNGKMRRFVASNGVNDDDWVKGLDANVSDKSIGFCKYQYNLILASSFCFLSVSVNQMPGVRTCDVVFRIK